jgi:hypothetical protein
MTARAVGGTDQTDRVALPAAAASLATVRVAVHSVPHTVATVIARPVPVTRAGASEVDGTMIVDPTASALREKAVAAPTESALREKAVAAPTASALREKAVAAPTASALREKAVAGPTESAPLETAIVAPTASVDPVTVTNVPTAVSGPAAGTGSVARTEQIVDPVRGTAVPTAATEPRAVRVTDARMPAAGTARVAVMAMGPEAVLVGMAGRREDRNRAGTTVPVAGRVDLKTANVAAVHA